VKNKFRVPSAVGLLTARTLALAAVPGVQLLANFEKLASWVLMGYRQRMCVSFLKNLNTKDTTPALPLRSASGTIVAGGARESTKGEWLHYFALPSLA